MPVTAEYPDWLLRFQPQVPLEELIQEVNNLFHFYGASRYDRDHPEIHQQLPPIWEEMIASLPKRRQWRVLDFGCGTGFEAAQVLGNLGSRVASMTLYDPSPAMLEQCKVRLADRKNLRYCHSREEIGDKPPYDLLLTNSLLHHLPHVENTITGLLPLLSNDAFWIAGHEPSVRLFRNPTCVAFAHAYARREEARRQWVKYLSPRAYLRKIRQLLRLRGDDDPYTATASAALHRGLFRVRPTEATIDMLVDFHVAHSADEVAAGRGLDITTMQEDFEGVWKLHWSTSYSYFGALNPMQAPRTWAKRAAALARAFPEDGAMACAVWRRVDGSQLHVADN